MPALFWRLSSSKSIIPIWGHYWHLRGPEAKNSPLFTWHIFKNFMRKEPCAKFYGVLIGSRKLWSYKVLNPALPTPYPRMYKTFQPWFSFPIFVNFMEKGLSTHSYGWSFWPFIMKIKLSRRTWHHTSEWTYIIC